MFLKKLALAAAFALAAIPAFAQNYGSPTFPTATITTLGTTTLNGTTVNAGALNVTGAAALNGGATTTTLGATTLNATTTNTSALNATGAVTFSGLPTSAPTAANTPWNNNGVLMMSGGPGYFPVDVTQRVPSVYDDNRWYSSGDGYGGYWTNVQSYGDIWGYGGPSDTQYQMWQLAQPASGAAAWKQVDAQLPCDGLQALSCTVGISPYALTKSFTGTNGTLYKLNTAGTALLSHTVLGPLTPYAAYDVNRSDADAFCNGTNLFLNQSCHWIPAEQINGYAVTSDWSLGPVITIASAGVGASQNGTKTLTLNMAGCGSVGQAAAISVTIAGNVVTAVNNPPYAATSAGFGECIGAGGSATQTAIAGSVTFTTYPTFTVVWVPTYAPVWSTKNNVNGLRAAIWNTSPSKFGTTGTGQTGVPTQNTLLRVATASYNTAASFVAFSGVSLDSNGSSGTGGGYFTLTNTTDGNYGINIGGAAINGIQSVTGTAAARCVQNSHIVRSQANMPEVLLVNTNASGANCWANNDYIGMTTAWPGETSTGMNWGAGNYTYGSNNNAVSFDGDAVAMIMGATPATTGLANSYADLNQIRLSLTKMMHGKPQANMIATVSASDYGMDGGNEGTDSWMRLALANIRTSQGGPVGFKGYQISAAGALLGFDITAFNLPRGVANVYYDSGCDAAPLCAMELNGNRVELEYFCPGGTTSCVTTAASAVISGTTMALTTSGAAEVAIGSVISGGGCATAQTITGFQSGSVGISGNYTVSPGGSETCTNATITTTFAQVAGFISGVFKNWVYMIHQLAAGYYAYSATLPSTAGISGMAAGNYITLTPPSGVTCNVYVGSGGAAVASNPVLEITQVVSGVPVQWNINYGPSTNGTGVANHGFCSGASLTGASVISSGWVPTGGSGSWGSATFTLNMLAATTPKAIIGRFPLQADTLATSYQLAVLEPVALGGTGLYDDMLANATVAQPTPCTTIATCVTLGTGYGADALHDTFGDTNLGANQWKYSAFSNNNFCSDGEHEDGYGNILSAFPYQKTLLPLIPYQ